MAGVRSTPRKSGVYQGWFVDTRGKRKFFPGTTRKRETLEMAQRLEDEHRQVRLGYRPAPHPSAKYRGRFFEEVMRDYLAWGRLEGGLKGFPWSSHHAHKREFHLGWWKQRLQLRTLADLDEIQPEVERALRGLDAVGKSGKTLANYAEALTAFCDWCVKRKYLESDPLKELGVRDTTPRMRRRAMKAEEIHQLLSTCAPHRRLTYETAFVSGLRVNELRNLTADHLDAERGGLHLEARWTKNRVAEFQPLPVSLVQRLRESLDSGEVVALYQRFCSRKDSNRKLPKNPLLYIPSSPSHAIDIDLEAAGIPKYAPGGKLDFHACRVAYINLVIESGASVKESQSLARHATPELTMNVYGKARNDRLSETVERVAAMLLKTEKCATYVPQKVVGESAMAASSNEINQLRCIEGAANQGFDPPQLHHAAHPTLVGHPFNFLFSDSHQETLDLHNIIDVMKPQNACE